MVSTSHNEITGPVSGPVVQAGIVHGDVHLHASSQVSPALDGLPADEGFSGRQRELAILADFLSPREAADGSPAVLVAGLAGVGKSALVVHAARHAVHAGLFPGGVLFVNLHGYDSLRALDSQVALAALLHALGVPEDQIPAGQGEREGRYRSELNARARQHGRILVVADNVAELEQVAPLGPPGPDQLLMTTSRHSLPLPGARRIELEILSPAESTDMLQAALHAADPHDERLNNNLDRADRMGALCGHLPLAVRVIAAVLVERPDLSIADVIQQLTDTRSRLDEFAYDDSVDVRSAFETSYQYQPEIQRRLFRRMSLNPGPHVGLEAAAALVDQPRTTTRRWLDALRRAHLIQLAPGGHDFHDLVRLYAQECSTRDDPPAELDLAIGRLLATYRDLAGAANAQSNPRIGAQSTARFPDKAAASNWLDVEFFNLVAAIKLAESRGQDNYVRDIASALGHHLNVSIHFNYGVDVYRRALGAAQRLGDQAGEAEALDNLGNSHHARREFEAALVAYEQALTIWRQRGNRRAEGSTLHNIGFLYASARRFDEALNIYSQALSIRQESHDRHGTGHTLDNMGVALRERGLHQAAYQHYTRALQIRRELGDRYSEARSLANIGVLLSSIGNQTAALHALQESLKIRTDIGDTRGEGEVYFNIASIYRHLSNPAAALEYYEKDLAICQQQERLLGEAQTLVAIGCVHDELGNSERAVAILEQAISMLQDLNDPYNQAIALDSLAAVLEGQNRNTEALTYLNEALHLFASSNAPTNAERVRRTINKLTSQGQGT